MSVSLFRNLERSEAIFEGPNRPARIGTECFERFEGRVAVVQRTDVAKLDCEISSCLEPSQRETLCTTNIRALLVDAAATLRVEERAPTLNMRNAGREQLGMVSANAIRLDLENR